MSKAIVVYRNLGEISLFLNDLNYSTVQEYTVLKCLNFTRTVYTTDSRVILSFSSCMTHNFCWDVEFQSLNQKKDLYFVILNIIYHDISDIKYSNILEFRSFANAC